MNASTPTLDASIRRLSSFDFGTALFAHSVPIRREASAAFERLALDLR